MLNVLSKGECESLKKQQEFARGEKLKKRIGSNIDFLSILGLLEISRMYIDSGNSVRAIQIATALDLPIESVLSLYKRLHQMGLVHLDEEWASQENTCAKPSQWAYSLLRELALGMEKNSLLKVDVYRQSKISLGRKVDLNLFKTFPDSILESKWKRIKCHFRGLGLTVYLYENGKVDFKGRNTSEIHERIALSQLMRFANQECSFAEIRPYQYAITVDLGRFVKYIDLERLLWDIRSLRNVGAMFEPERAPLVNLRITFQGSSDECTVLLWSSGRFKSYASSYALAEKGIVFMFYYLSQTEWWDWKFE